MKASPGVVTRTLSHPGQAYAIYMEGRLPTELTLALPAGKWKIEWLNPTDGSRSKAEGWKHSGGMHRLPSPAMEGPAALRIMRIAD